MTHVFLFNFHRLGHNYRLGHALDPIEDGDDMYGDLTGMMGGGTETRKCFNGYNYFVLGWHSEQTNEVPLVSGEAARYNLAGIGHVSEGNVVNIKAGEYFITFNLKTFFNSGIDRAGYDEDYPNEVLIHQGQDIMFGQSIHSAYHDTSLVGSLAEVNNRYMVEVVDIGNVVGDLIIQICSLDPMGTGSVELSIGVDAVDCDTMGNVNTPQGMQILTSGVPVMGLSATQDEIIEFKMDLPYEPEKVICTTFGGSGDVDLIMNFDSSPQVLYSSTINTVRTLFRERDAFLSISTISLIMNTFLVCSVLLSYFWKSRSLRKSNQWSSECLCNPGCLRSVQWCDSLLHRGGWL